MVGYLNKLEEKAVIELKKKLQESLGKDFKNIILYGSKARGDFNAESDIDLLVIVENLDLNKKHNINDIVVDIQLEYELPISVHTRDLNYYKEQKMNSVNFFIKNIDNEGIAVWTSKRKK